MSSTDPGFPLISAEEFLENMGGDPELCITIIETGLKEGEEQAEQIRSLTAESDGESSRRLLHSLRGGSATFGARSLVALLQMMESACEADGVGAVLPHLGTFEAESRGYQEGLLRLIEEMRARL